MFFCHPPAVAFWFLVRETGGFLKGWPRFIPVCRSTFEPAGGTVEAQSVMVTAPPVLCCMGDRLGIPMNFFFFFFFCISLPSYLPSSLLLHLHPNFCSPLFSYRSLCFLIHLFLSFVVLIFRGSVSFFVCLSPSLPLSLFELRAVSSSSSRSELCSHLSHHWGRRNIFYWCCPLLSLAPSDFCVSPFQTIWFLPSLQLLSRLFSCSPRLFFPKFPIWPVFQEGSHSQNVKQSSYMCNFSISCCLNGRSHMLGSLPDLDFVADCITMTQDK